MLLRGWGYEEVGTKESKRLCRAVPLQFPVSPPVATGIPGGMSAIIDQQGSLVVWCEAYEFAELVAKI